MLFSEAMPALARQVATDMAAAFGWAANIPIYINDARVPENAEEYGEIEISILDIKVESPQIDVVTVQVEASARFPEPAAGLRYDFQIAQVAALRALFTPALSIDGRTGYGLILGAPIGQSAKVTAIDLQDIEANETEGVEIGVTMTCKVRVRRATA